MSRHLAGVLCHSHCSSRELERGHLPCEAFSQVLVRLCNRIWQDGDEISRFEVGNCSTLCLQEGVPKVCGQSQSGIFSKNVGGKSFTSSSDSQSLLLNLCISSSISVMLRDALAIGFHSKPFYCRITAPSP